MTHWTLALDESGRFEGTAIPGEKPERRGFVVGGVLFPLSAEEASKRWRDSFAALCRGLDTHYPPHSNQLTLKQTDMLRARATSEVAKVGGRWIFLVAAPERGDVSPAKKLSRYVRMLGELVDLAARQVALRGGRTLDVLPAQRTIPLDPTLERQAQVAGRLIVPNEEGEERKLRALSEVEVRHTLDAVRRGDVGWSVPYPNVGAIEVRSAENRHVHPAVAFSDLGCNYIWRGMSGQDAMQRALADLGGDERVLLGDREETRRLRQIDRALRDTPPDLVRAARYVEELRGRAAGATTVRWSSVIARGTAFAAQEMWRLGVAALVPRIEKDRRWAALSRALAGQAEAVLAVKGGAYEGLCRALQEGWQGDTDLARGCREQPNLELAAQLWRLTIECANHRGDTQTAIDAANAAQAIFGRARSYRLLAERLQVTNLAVVTLQNALPAPAGDVDELREQLRKHTALLVDAAEEAGALVEMAFGDAAPDESGAVDEAELRLWRTDGDRAPAFERPDIERGRLYGTAARSHAFLGELDRAFELGMKARSLFAGSSFDLGFNASVLLRVELERARVGDAKPARIAALLELVGVSGVRKPSRVRERLGRGEHAIRFTLDVLLRALLWAPDAVPFPVDAWLKGLSDGKLLPLLSDGELRSHPTELLARHAGELLRAHGEADAAQRWLDLSVELCEASAPDSTIHRLGHASRLLREGDSALGEGGPGSLGNPTFEYR